MDTNNVDESLQYSQKILEAFNRDKIRPVVGQGACLAVCAASVAALRLPADKLALLTIQHQMLDLLVMYCEKRIASHGGIEAILATRPPPPPESSS